MSFIGHYWGFLRKDMTACLLCQSPHDTDTVTSLPPLKCAPPPPAFSPNSRSSDQTPLYSDLTRPLTTGEEKKEKKGKGSMTENKKKTLIKSQQILMPPNSFFVCMHTCIYLSIYLLIGLN